VSYQLPQELQTKKLNSLPEDLRAHAEELIAKKFDIAEVVKEGRYKDSSRLQDPFALPNNLLQLTVFFRRGYKYRLHLPLLTSMNWQERQDGLPTYYGERVRDPYKEDIAYNTARKVEDELRRYLSTSKGRQYGQVDYIEVEMNGYRQVIREMEEISRIVYERLA
jgi:hypothetical protein